MKGITYPQQQIPAVLDGSLTVTRRLVKPQIWYQETHEGGSYWDIMPRYYPGETVYVQETFAHCPVDFNDTKGIIYKADKKYNDYVCTFEWRSPVTMPEWASRQKQRVVSVRCERLQEITEEDAKCEGAECVIWHGNTAMRHQKQMPIATYRAGCANLWDKRYPKHPWDSNPWCFVYSMENIKEKP